MKRLFKLLIFLIIVGFIGIVGYAYLGPWFGSDFAAPQVQIRQPVVLNAE
ncbi:MAG: hypothetical protein AB8B51_01620 [Sedimentitalea sp.]